MDRYSLSRQESLLRPLSSRSRWPPCRRAGCRLDKNMVGRRDLDTVPENLRGGSGLEENAEYIYSIVLQSMATYWVHHLQCTISDKISRSRESVLLERSGLEGLALMRSGSTPFEIRPATFASHILDTTTSPIYALASHQNSSV
jgi:hypothetical protein